MLDKVGIVVPTYNESENLPIMIARLIRISDKIAKETEIVIVDDSSPDGTGDIAEALATKFQNIKVIHRLGKLGVGSAVLEGVRAVSAPYVIMMDADLHHRPEFVPSIAKYLNEYDIVIASRFVEGSRMGATSVRRRVVTKFGNALARSLLRLRVKDYTHGFRGYKKSSFLKCYRSEDVGGEFNLRLLIEANRRGLKTIEVPYNSEHMGVSRMRSWLKYLRLLMKESLLSWL